MVPLASPQAQMGTVNLQWGRDGNIPWESFSTPSAAFPGGPGWPRFSEPLPIYLGPRLSGKGWAGRIPRLTAGVRGHYEDSHCCKTWTPLTLAACHLGCVSCPSKLEMTTLRGL